jgi:hypothetical protein
MGAFGLAFAMAQLSNLAASPVTTAMPRKPIDLRAMQDFTSRLQPQTPDAETATRAMRDSDRY